jgi:D-alanine-D-alanine ligase-like ATP-grasp enzyme
MPIPELSKNNPNVLIPPALNSKCPYCGNNPVPHFINWYFESLNVLFTPIRQFLLTSSLTWVVKQVFHKFNLPWFWVKLFASIKIISFQTDVSKCKVRRGQVLWEEAIKRGLDFKELLLFGRPFDCYVIEKRSNGNELLRSKQTSYQMHLSSRVQPKRSRLLQSDALLRNDTATESQGITRIEDNSKSCLVFSGLPRPFNPNPSALDLLDDKAILKKKLIAGGLPVPNGDSAALLGTVKKIFSNIEKPVIVKPRLGSRGRHSTTFIYELEGLEKAFRAAKQLCYWVIVEEQLNGPVYRATVINYELCGVLRGDPPQVVGDGTATISQLVELKNSLPHPGVKNIVLDSTTEMFLARQNLKLSSVPAQGQIVNLTEKIGVNYGGSSSEDLDICHPDNKELFVRAAKVLGDPIVGFDFIIQDITKSYTEQKCGFIEANSLPFINLHHDPLLGTPQNVAGKVLDMMGLK